MVFPGPARPSHATCPKGLRPGAWRVLPEFSYLLTAFYRPKIFLCTATGGCLRLLRDGRIRAVHFPEDFVSATFQKRSSQALAQRLWVLARAYIAQHRGPVRTRHHSG